MSKAAAGHLRAYDADALRTQSRADFVYDSLRDAIWEGRFAHGERLREEEIASALGVSRTPVREALQRLQQRGLLVIGPGRGLMVAQLSKQQVFELYAMREILEGSAARLFWRGVWVNFSNPKTVPWILVIIQAGRLPTDGFHLSSLLALLVVTVVSETSVMSFYAFLADRLRRHLRTPAIVRAVDRVIGLLWLALAGLMAWQTWELVRA